MDSVVCDSRNDAMTMHVMLAAMTTVWIAHVACVAVVVASKGAPLNPCY